MKYGHQIRDRALAVSSQQSFVTKGRPIGWFSLLSRHRPYLHHRPTVYGRPLLPSSPFTLSLVCCWPLGAVWWISRKLRGFLRMHGMCMTYAHFFWLSVRPTRIPMDEKDGKQREKRQDVDSEGGLGCPYGVPISLFAGSFRPSPSCPSSDEWPNR